MSDEPRPSQHLVLGRTRRHATNGDKLFLDADKPVRIEWQEGLDMFPSVTICPEELGGERNMTYVKVIEHINELQREIYRLRKRVRGEDSE